MTNSDNTQESKLGRRVVKLSTYSEAEGLAASGANNLYVVFGDNAVKDFFARKCAHYVINCCASFNRFTEDMQGYSPDTVFYNVGECSEQRILDIINYTNNLVID